MAVRKKIALLVAQPEEGYHAAFIQGFIKQAFLDDYDVCIFSMYQRHQSTRNRIQGETSIYSLIEYERFDAVVILAIAVQTQGVVEEIEEKLHDSYPDKPVIIVDGHSNYSHQIVTDNYLPIKQMVAHLVEYHGYTDIAYLGGEKQHPHSKARLRGFLDSMQEHGLTVPEHHIFYGDFWYNSGTATAEQLLRDRENLPRAVVCGNDYMALGLMDALSKAGVRIPEEVAVTGYDNSEEGKRFSIPLTSMPIPTRACGEYAMQYVKTLLAGEEIKEFSAKVDPMIGKSCGCCKERRTLEDDANAKLWQFDFNEGTMEDDILIQTELSGVLNTTFSYVHQIRPFAGFHLCLNTHWTNENFLNGTEVCNTYSDRMIDALKCGPEDAGEDRIDMTAEFDRRDLLPELNEESEKPRAYYFTPLFFEEHCFGYAAICYGEVIRCYDAVYKRWLSTVMHGLECFWRINMLQSKNEQLEKSQIRDAMTGLYNYKGFLKTAMASLESLSGSMINLAVAELDGSGELYRKRSIQDGDKAILDFAQMLMLTTQKELTCYLGNGEFLVAEISLEEGADFAPLLEKVRERLAEYCHDNALDGKLDLVYAVMQGQAATEEKLSNLVGEAVSLKNGNKLKQQRQKQSGLTQDESGKMDLVADILDNNRLLYHFQPIVDAGTGEIFAYEALMRADCPEPVSPLEILKCAEHMGRLQDVEKATFINVLTYLETHEEQFANRKIFINSIPGVQVDPADAEIIREKLMKFSGRLIVELTEQAELGDDELESLKNKYKNLGVDIAIDDYGTGYSNVYNLLRYMPNVVKIDRMLLANIQLNAQKQHFVKEIIEFSHNNKISVLAEGVETSEELKMVTLLGADLIQGYYTARPNAQVLPRIENRIRNEIVQYGQYALEKSKRKVFQAGQDGNISLIKLASAHYSKIRFSQEKAPHRFVVINGLQGFQASMEIEMDDGYCGRIEIKNVDLAVHNEQPAIRLGENCDVTLVLNGENILEHGGILVPASSKLTVQGNGNLQIRHIAVDGYGIGNDKNETHGDLHFEQDGDIRIQGNTMHGVGIGSGKGGKIRIDRGRYVFQLAGEEAVGIGSLEAQTDLSIHNCAIELGLKNSVNVGIGSIRGNVKLDISFAGMSGLFSASRCVCIGTLDGDRFDMTLTEATTDFEARAECLCGVGSTRGDVNVSISKFSFKINVEGREAIAMGNHTKTARIRTHNGDQVMEVKNQLDFDIGTASYEIINGHSEFIHNGVAVIREVIPGEM